MSDAFEKLLSQGYIAFALASLEQYHSVVTVDDKLQARQSLRGKFKVFPPPLTASPLHAFKDQAPVNPIETQKLEGEVQMHFLPTETFSEAKGAGVVGLYEPSERSPKACWLALDLYLPNQFFDRLPRTKYIQCTVEGLQRPLELGAYHWVEAFKKPLIVRDALFSDSLPSR